MGGHGDASASVPHSTFSIPLPALTALMAVSCAIEVTTSAALMVSPALVARLLLHAELSLAGNSVARLCAVALFSLGLACWPSARPEELRPAVRGLVVYNGLASALLAGIGLGRHQVGVLLIPAVAIHAALFFLLLLARRTGLPRSRVGLDEGPWM